MTTPIDLVSCESEPIHIPGSIQPHGSMLVVEVEGLGVVNVAGDIHARVGVPYTDGQPLGVVIGKTLENEIRDRVDEDRPGGFVGQLVLGGGEILDVSAHRSGAHMLVELEPASMDPSLPAIVLDRLAVAASAFELTVSLATLCERAAIEFRRLTQFDRVMIYRFLDDGVGTVVAEDKRADLHSYLNQHYPATDIPRQARALYLRNLCRVIPDITYRALHLLPAQSPSPASLDMSDSALRSVSPIHLQYLANMGVRASASFSIVKDGALWGLVACHNETPRYLPYDVRSFGCALAGSLGRQLRAQEEAEVFRHRIRLRNFEADIVAMLAGDGSIDTALSLHLSEIEKMMGSNGVAVVRGRELVTSGTCPGETEIRDLVAWLRGRPDEPVLSTNRLSTLYPSASRFQASGSGLLAITMSGEEPWVMLWFRQEQVETVNWAGNPHKESQADPLTPLNPRASFAAWAEVVRGHSRIWSTSEIEAALRLRLALLEAQQGRRMKELNHQLTNIIRDKDLLLQQKEILIGEVNHRIQNSLQLVSSFLGIQARESDNSRLHAALDEARRRLTAVALVHRRLYRSDQITMVDAARYIEELCADTVSYMGDAWAPHLALRLSPMLISTDRAVILGLILTELLINANKYAYGGKAGPIEIGLEEDLTHLRLIVADNGVGKLSARQGFGSRIVEGLLGQLGGEITMADNQPGVRSTISVPIKAITQQ